MGTASEARGRQSRLSERGAEGSGEPCGGLREYYSIEEGICQVYEKIPRQAGDV